MMSVAITITPVFRSGTPLEIWRKAYFSQQLMTTNYDVAADGRFLMLRVPDERGGTMATVSVILNWRKELKDRGLVR